MYIYSRCDTSEDSFCFAFLLLKVFEKLMIHLE